MKLTKAHNSDFLLLGGDLYDKNEPGCKTHEETIKILEKVFVQVLCDLHCFLFHFSMCLVSTSQNLS